MKAGKPGRACPAPRLPDWGQADFEAPADGSRSSDTNSIQLW